MELSRVNTESRSAASINRWPSNRALKKYGLKNSGLTAEVDAEHTEFNFDLK